MSLEQTSQPPQAQPPQPKPAIAVRAEEMSRRLKAGAWGLFFIWLGIVVLANIGWSWSLFGIGLIIVGEQVTRSRFQLPVNALWAACGAIFLIGGVWEIFNLSWPLAPLMLILLGAAILWNGFFGKGAGPE